MRVFAIFVALLMPLVSGAQSLGGLGGISGDAFSLSVTPQYPAPFGQATVSLVSTALDLTRATLTVLVNGKETYKGSVRSFSVPLGKTGSATSVKITVSLDGANHTKTLTLVPQDVSLVAEPISSAPPLYRGKPHVPLEGKVRVVALANLRDANGTTANPASYSYAWTVDGVRISNSSGVGKSAIIIDSPLEYRTRDISVAVTSGGGTLVGGAALSLSAHRPVVRIYAIDPLQGIRYDRALSGEYAVSGAESTLFAAPFSLPTTNGAPSIQWFINGAPAQTGNTITLRPTGNGQGNASLSLVASAGALATALASLSLSFGAPSGGNFFGL